MPRLFTAIEIPEEIRAELARMRVPLPGAKWVQGEDLHLTLRFAGDIDTLKAREFSANLAHVDADVFTLRIAGVGAFGGRDPHSVWAGVEAPPELEALQRAHERAARNAGLAPEKRAFRPHVTLARLRSAKADDVARFLTQFGGYRSEPFTVERAALMASKPLTGGGPYVVEESFALRGSGYAFDDTGEAWSEQHED